MLLSVKDAVLSVKASALSVKADLLSVKVKLLSVKVKLLSVKVEMLNVKAETLSVKVLNVKTQIVNTSHLSVRICQSKKLRLLVWERPCVPKTQIASIPIHKHIEPCNPHEKKIGEQHTFYISENPPIKRRAALKNYPFRSWISQFAMFENTAGWF